MGSSTPKDRRLEKTFFYLLWMTAMATGGISGSLTLINANVSYGVGCGLGGLVLTFAAVFILTKDILKIWSVR